MTFKCFSEMLRVQVPAIGGEFLTASKWSLKVLQDNKILKLDRISALHLNEVDRTREENLVVVSNSEKERKPSQLVTNLKKDDSCSA